MFSRRRLPKSRSVKADFQVTPVLFTFTAIRLTPGTLTKVSAAKIKKNRAICPFRFFLAAPVYQYNKTQIAFLRIPLLRPSVIFRRGVYYSLCRSFYLRRLDMIPYCLLLASLLPCFLCSLPALPPLPPPTARLALFLFAAASATAASTYTL